MSKNKFGAYQTGQQVIFNNKIVTITDKIKGNKTLTPNKQSGITTGFKSNPCLYLLSNGLKVRGDKLKNINLSVLS